MKSFFLTLILIYSNQILSQSTINELEKSLDTTSSATVKIDIFNELSWLYRKDTSNNALVFADSALVLAERIGDLERYATALNRKGIALKYQRNYNSALLLYEKALLVETEIKHEYGIARVNFQIGNIYFHLNLYEQALEYFNVCLKYYRETNDLVNENKTLNKLGIINKNIGEYDKSIRYFNEALEIGEEMSNAKTLVDLAILYQRLGQHNKAQNLLEKSTAFFIENDNQVDYLNSLNNLGNNALYLNDYSVAHTKFEELKEYSEKLGYENFTAISLNGLGLVAKEEKNFNKSIENFKAYLDYVIDYEDTIQIAQTYANIGLVYFDLKKDTLQTINYLEKSLEFIDKIGDLALRKQILEILKVCYLAKNKLEEASLVSSQLLDIEEKLYENTRNANMFIDNLNLKIERQQILLITLIFGFILMIIISFFALRSYRNRQKVKMSEKDNELKQKKIDTLLREIELKSTYAKLEGQDNERKRIAKDLHDRLGGILSTVKLYFNSVEGKIEELKQENRVQYEKANQLLDKAVTEVREIAHNMNSGILSKFGLVAELEEMVDTIKKSNQIEIQFITHNMKERLYSSVEMEVYQIIQELISNILKHADATKITLQLLRDGNVLSILVEDNGKGFEVGKVRKGIGLKNIAARVDKLNGEMLLDTALGRGTIFSIDVNIQ